MDGPTRVILEMGDRVVKLNLSVPQGDSGYAMAATKVEELVTRAALVAALQREGLVERHSAAVQKKKLRRQIRSGPIAHLAQVGRVAEQEKHELGVLFRFKPDADTHLAVRTAAGNMFTNAETHRDVLVKYGLSLPVLEEFGRLLQEFDAAVVLGNAAQAKHVGATRELRAIAREIRRTVQVMDGSNRQRFKNDPQLLGGWISASKVARRPQASSATEASGGSPPPAGDVRPAA